MVLGKTGREPVVRLSHRTFCTLCTKRIERQEGCLEIGERWHAHMDCEAPDVVSRMTKAEFKRVAKRGKRQYKKCAVDPKRR